MMKCSVRSVRKWSSGSYTLAARAVLYAAATNKNSRIAVRVRATPLRSADLSGRALGLARRAREDDAEDERGHTKETADDEKKRVAFEERPPGGQPLDHHARETLRELADVGVSGAEQRILRRGVA